MKKRFIFAFIAALLLASQAAAQSVSPITNDDFSKETDKVIRFGEQPIKLGLAAYYNAIGPTASEDPWQFQATLTFIETSSEIGEPCVLVRVVCCIRRTAPRPRRGSAQVIRAMGLKTLTAVQ